MGAAAGTNIYLEGNFAPVDDELTAEDLPVTGRIPERLRGRYLRNGPNPVDPDPATYHWFTGNGMVHGVRLEGGRARWYRNRFVRGDAIVEARGWPAVPGRRGAMGGPVGPNTNVIGHAGRTYAIVEAGSSAMELTDELETVAWSDFDGTLPGSFTAHPKRDPATGELHAVVYYWEWDYIEYVRVGTDGRVNKVVDIPVPGKPMVHDTAITETQVVLFDLPVTFNLDAAMAGSVFPYQWDPDYGARVGLLPRDGGAEDVRWSEVDLCYVYHPLNAYDLPDGRVVLDVVRHPKMFASDLHGPNEGEPTLERWTVDPIAGKVLEERLDDRGQEFPRMDERRLGRAHRYGYTAAFGVDATHGPLLKQDLGDGTSQVHDFGPGRASGEAVFVPRSDDAAAAEDDGWLLSLVYDAASDTSELAILDAQDFAGPPVATVALPQRVPFGFHGNWLADPG
jgi:carotenoid cleavage dioxygenase